MQGVYSVKDMLSENDIMKIWDVSTSKTLQNRAVFIGRAIPVDAKAENFFNLLGTVTELPPKLWAILSESITSWSDEYCAQNQSSSTRDFFRAYHARIRCKILKIIEDHKTEKTKRLKKVKISSMKIKTASDLHTFVKKTLKKGGGDERLMQAPDTMKYMNKFKHLMDTSSSEEMDYLSNRFKGFYRFGKMLESLAMGIERGDIEVP